MRRLAAAALTWRAGRPKLLPFVPVLLRALLRPRPLPEAPRPTHVPRGRRAPVPVAGDVVAFSVIRNGITNGYPFVEAYGSWLDTCRRIVILDGESTARTREALDALAEIDDRVVVGSRPWPSAREGGGAIAEFTNAALSLARPAAGTLVYLQADELYSEPLRRQAAQADAHALEFPDCVNFWNSFDTVVANEFPMRYVRAFPAESAVQSIGDGFSFELGDLPVHRSPDLILHYGWCFPVNILRKHVSHAALYRDNPVYRARGALASTMLRAGSVDRRLIDALAPGYGPAPYAGGHPPAVRHLVGMQVYDPEPGLELLADGAVW